MARWAPMRADVITELVTEWRHNVLGGRVVVAIDSFDGAHRVAFADDVAAAFEAGGLAAERASYEGDEAGFRSGTLAAFRAGVGEAVLVVDGEGLLVPSLIGIWHSNAWLDAPDAPIDDDRRRYLTRVDPRRRALTNIALADPAHPRRTFADSC